MFPAASSASKSFLACSYDGTVESVVWFPESPVLVPVDPPPVIPDVSPSIETGMR